MTPRKPLIAAAIVAVTLTTGAMAYAATSLTSAPKDNVGQLRFTAEPATVTVYVDRPNTTATSTSTPASAPIAAPTPNPVPYQTPQQTYVATPTPPAPVAQPAPSPATTQAPSTSRTTPTTAPHHDDAADHKTEVRDD